jgi:hypothetical protein
MGATLSLKTYQHNYSAVKDSAVSLDVGMSSPSTDLQALLPLEVLVLPTLDTSLAKEIASEALVSSVLPPRFGQEIVNEYLADSTANSTVEMSEGRAGSSVSGRIAEAEAILVQMEARNYEHLLLAMLREGAGGATSDVAARVQTPPHSVLSLYEGYVRPALAANKDHTLAANEDHTLAA